MSLWSWVLGVIGVTGMFFAGRKLWWGWGINLANEVLWIIYAIQTAQYGFIFMAVAYGAVYTRNLHSWRRSVDLHPSRDTRD